MGYTTRIPIRKIYEPSNGTGTIEITPGDVADARALLRQATNDYSAYGVSDLGIGIVAKLAHVRQAFSLRGIPYEGEMRLWAERIGVDLSMMTLLNLTYELSHLTGVVFGCTAGVRWVEGLGMVHVRNMDWPLSNIGRATRIYEHYYDSGIAYSVGIAGYSGVLSAMVPGKYSVTINWAPPRDTPTFSMVDGPSFVLRRALQCCRSYLDVVEYLSTEELSTPVFYTVCGKRKHEACVIERLKGNRASIRMIGDHAALAQANDYVAMNSHNGTFDRECLEFSDERRRIMKNALTGVASAKKLDDVAEVLDEDWVLNEDTFQQMVFSPATSQMKVWRWL